MSRHRLGTKPPTACLTVRFQGRLASLKFPLTRSTNAFPERAQIEIVLLGPDGPLPRRIEVLGGIAVGVEQTGVTQPSRGCEQLPHRSKLLLKFTIGNTKHHPGARRASQKLQAVSVELVGQRIFAGDFLQLLAKFLLRFLFQGLHDQAVGHDLNWLGTGTDEVNFKGLAGRIPQRGQKDLHRSTRTLGRARLPRGRRPRRGVRQHAGVCRAHLSLRQSRHHQISQGSPKARQARSAPRDLVVRTVAEIISHSWMDATCSSTSAGKRIF